MENPLDIKATIMISPWECARRTGSEPAGPCRLTAGIAGGSVAQARRDVSGRGRRTDDPDGLVVEAWAQGFMVGTLVFMAGIAVANMRPRILLHKLILVELGLGIGHGTFIFLHGPAYGWYLSATAIGLNVSWSLHNVIAWMKIKPFLSRNQSVFYISTVLLVQPYWVLEIYANFAYFNNINKLFEKTRPFEALFRDPWWVCAMCHLVWTVKSHYSFGLAELLRISPRFAILLVSMCLSVAFIVVDVLSVLGAFQIGLPTGINPFWKLSYVFKCLCDTVILDDFKTALDRMRDCWLARNAQSEISGSRPTQSARSSGIRLCPNPFAKVEAVELELPRRAYSPVNEKIASPVGVV